MFKCRGNNFTTHFLNPVIILITALVCHGMVLISDVVVLDDWVYLSEITHSMWDPLYNAHVWYSSTMFLPFIWFFTLFDNPRAIAGIVSLFIIISSSLLVYLILLKLNYLTRTDNLLLALIFMVYPGFMMHFSITLMQFTFCLLSFLIAANCMICPSSILFRALCARWPLIFNNGILGWPNHYLR